MRRALRWLLLPLGLLAAITVAALLWALFTTSGAAFVLGVVADRTGVIEYAGVDGRLAGPLELRRFVYHDGATRVEAERVQLAWQPLSLLRDRLQIEMLHAQAVRVTTGGDDADGAADQGRGDAITQLPFDLVIGDAQIDRLTVDYAEESEPLVFEAIDLSGRWVGDEVAIERLAFDWEALGGPVALAGRATLEPRQLQVHELALSGAGQLWIEGTFGYATPSDLDLRWRDLQWPLRGEPAVQSARGSASWTGRFDDYRFALDAALRAAGHAGEVSAKGSGTLEAVELDSFEGTALGGTLDGTGRIAWSPQLRIQANAEVDGIDPERIAPDWPGRISGQMEVSSHFDGDLSEIVFDVALKDSELRGYPLRLTSHGRWDGEALRLQQFDLASGASRLHGSGRVWPDLDLDARLDSDDLASLWPELQGEAQLSAQARGPYRWPRLELRGSAQALRYADTAIRRARIEGTVDLERVTQLTLEASGLRRDKELVAKTLTLQLDGRVDDHRLEVAIDAPQARATLALEGAARIEAREWQGRLVAGELTPANFAALTLTEPAALAASPTQVSLSPACWRSDAARACIEGRATPEAQQLSLDLAAFPLSALQDALPQRVAIDAVLSGRAQLRLAGGAVEDLDLHLVSTEGTVRAGRRTLLRFLPASARVIDENGTLRARLTVPFPEGEIDLDARLAPAAQFSERPLSGTLHIEVSQLQWLQLLVQDIESVSGRIAGEVRLGGEVGEPRLQGTIALRDGSVALFTPGIQLTDVSAQLQGSTMEPTLELQAQAQSGEGSISLEGQVFLPPSPMRVELSLHGENFQAVNLPDIRARVSPDLELTVTEEGAELTGTVVVPRAQITPATFDGGIAPSGDQVIVRAEEEVETPAGALPFEAHVRVVLGDDVRFEGFGLKARLTGAINLHEEPGRETIGFGQINLVEGRYQAYGQDLNIQTGRLIFSRGPVTDPAVEIRAQRQPREDITVGVYVRGRLDSPEFSLYSTPAMPQEAQLSWLVLGRPLETAGGDAERGVLASAALSLGLTGSDYLAQRVRGGLGLDEIAIGARPGESAEAAALTLGKYLSPDLYIAYGVSLFQPGQTFRLRYDIGGGFKLQAEGGVESGGDLLYSVER